MFTGLPLNIWSKTAIEAAKEVGARALRVGLRRAGAKTIAKLMIESSAWKRAFVHIAEHFAIDAIKEKGQHTVFTLALRSTEAIKPLIVATAKGPSHKYISRALVHSVRAGKPVIVLERVFQEVIGETFKEIEENGVKKIVKTADCKVMRIILDLKGTPLSAYPVEALSHVP